MAETKVQRTKSHNGDGPGLGWNLTHEVMRKRETQSCDTGSILIDPDVFDLSYRMMRTNALAGQTIWCMRPSTRLYQ